MAERVKADLRRVKDIALTHDTWTSASTDSYSCVTAHFINEDWELCTVLLQTKKHYGAHTSEAIAEDMLLCKEQWLPECQIPTAVTDNASNERKAFDKLLSWPRCGCFGHRINLIVKKAIALPAVATLIAKGRKLVTFFHQSTSAAGN